jgi:hypothetical protein
LSNGTADAVCLPSVRLFQWGDNSDGHRTGAAVNMRVARGMAFPAE